MRISRSRDGDRRRDVGSAEVRLAKDFKRIAREALGAARPAVNSDFIEPATEVICLGQQLDPRKRAGRLNRDPFKNASSRQNDAGFGIGQIHAENAACDEAPSPADPTLPSDAWLRRSAEKNPRREAAREIPQRHNRRQPFGAATADHHVRLLDRGEKLLRLLWTK